MSFNFGSLQQKADQVLHNADEAIRKWQEFVSAPAGNVNFQYYDKNGNLQTVTFPNRNKVVNDFIANANYVFRKRVHVHQLDGSDTTGTGSETAPFQSIEKAQSVIPSGGYVEVKLLDNYIVSKNKPNREVIGANKYVEIFADVDTNGNPIYTLKNDPSVGVYSGFVIYDNTTAHVKNLIIESNDTGNSSIHWKMLFKIAIGAINTNVRIGKWGDTQSTKIILNGTELIDFESATGFLNLVKTDIDAPGRSSSNPIDIVFNRADKTVVFNYTNLNDLTGGGVNIPPRGII